MIHNVSSRDSLSVRSAPPQARTRPAPAEPGQQDRVVLGSTPEAAESEPTSRLGTWQGLALVGLGALTLAGCAGIPGYVGGVAVQPQAPISRTVETRETRPFAGQEKKAPAASTPSVFQNVFSKPYPRPATWQQHSIDLGATSYQTIAPPSGWTFGQAGQGFQITNAQDPAVYLQLQNVESSTGLGDLQGVMEARKASLREQGMDLREVDAVSSGRDFFVSVNEFQRDGKTWRAEVFVNGDVGTDNQNYSATVTTIVYPAGEHGDVFPTILQNTVKSITMDMPLPVPR